MSIPYYNTLTEEQYNQLTEAQYNTLLESPTSSIADGTIVLDQYNQQYKYDARLNQWIFIGPLIPYQIVSLHQHGLITPAILTELTKLETDYPDFKVYPVQDVYWYFVRSRDRTLAIHSSTGQVNIEIDTNLLTRRMFAYGKGCPQVKGVAGIQGADGANGAAGSKEISYTVGSGKVLNIAKTVRTPLDTPISLRLFQGDNQVIELVYDIGSGGHIITYAEGFTRQLADPQIILDQERFVTSLQFQDGLDWGDGWTYKIRQRGPTGADGQDGDSLVRINELSVSDPGVVYNKACRIIRANQRGNLFNINADFSSLISVCSHIRPNNSFGDSYNSLKPPKPRSNRYPRPLNEEEADYWGAMEPTVDGGKSIHRWGLDKETYEAGDLNQPVWDPNNEPSKSIYIPFNWFENASLPTLPFDIIYSQQPEAPSGEQELFYCPNIGEPCDVCPTFEEGEFAGDINDVG